VIAGPVRLRAKRFGETSPKPEGRRRVVRQPHPQPPHRAQHARRGPRL